MLTRFVCALSCVAFTAFALAQEADPAKKPDVKRPVLEFKGRIDGSELIDITAIKAVWHHVNRAFPSMPVTVNGIPWNPRKNAELLNAGATKFLDGAVD